MSYPLESQVSLTRQFSRAAAWRSRHSLKDDDELEVDQMARVANNRRARLISQIVFPPREFTSYFHGNVRRSEHPHLVTSHARPPPRRTFQTFPSMMPSLRWNPYVETSSIAQTDAHDSSPLTYNCRCKACTSQKCPTNAMSPLTYIATFCNQCTMTPQVNDVSCGICKGVSPPPRVSEVSVSVKNNRSLVIEDFTYEPRCAPIPPPILKPSICESVGECITRRRTKSRVSHEPVRDIDEEFSPLHSSSEKCSRKIKNKRSELSCKAKSNPPSDEEEFVTQPVSRKPLYNEGISDSVANHLSRCPHDTSNYRVKARCWPEPDNFIPYSHTGHSKYHQRCKEQPPVRYRGCEEELRHFAGCPQALIKQARASSGCSRHPSPPRPCSPYPPRKLLASERDIDSYVSRRDRCDRDRYSRCCDDSHY